MQMQAPAAIALMPKSNNPFIFQLKHKAPRYVDKCVKRMNLG